MKFLLLFFVCVAVVSYYGAEGDDKTDEINELEEEEEGRRQFPYQGSAQAAANAQGMYRPTWLSPIPTRPWPTPTPTARPTNHPKPTRCFSCTDCQDPSKLTPQNTCISYSDDRCVVYVEKYDYRRNPVYVRGCISERGTCEDIRRSHERQHIKLLSCDECVGDLCNTNGVARSLPDLTAAIFFVVLTPMLTKYALS